MDTNKAYYYILKSMKMEWDIIFNTLGGQRYFNIFNPEMLIFGFIGQVQD